MQCNDCIRSHRIAGNGDYVLATVISVLFGEGYAELGHFVMLAIALMSL